MIVQRFMMMLIARFIRSEKDSDEVYGAPRITAELAECYQISVNRKTVAKRMRLMGIEGMSPRACVPVTTIQSKRKSSLPELVKRMFDTGELNRVWMSDIYLSAHW
ncbi:IS3 family transposase [Corynebacterium macginleyi]|uniref:IS3 family transposase n=1 Tax=Corynebacterium macginleyi TaxID=38290 RepID=UPI00217D7B0A|nr:IS3 family transposase [Corynebacterium macginleyi]